MEVIRGLALNGVLIAVIGHGLIGLSLVWDKVLLQKRSTQNLLSYVFWLGAISIFGLLLIPFGFKLPTLQVAAVGFGAGALDLIGSYFYYSALKAGEASEELAVMGGFTPVATALIAIPLLKAPMGNQFTGFGLMTSGGFLMFLAERRPLKRMLPKIVLASAAFGLTSVLQKVTFNQTNFVSGYVFFTLGTSIGSACLAIPPSWRKQIFEHSGSEEPRSKAWYLVNRFTAGVGSFLVVFAVSRASPPVVESISGVRYAVIFLLAYAITKWKPSWLREEFRAWILVTKIASTLLVIAGLVLVGLHGGRGGSSGPE